jgi:release factor glutamine methyltransferase
MEIREALKTGIRTLRDGNIHAYTLAAELLLLHAIGKERAWLYAHPEEQLSAAQEKQFLEMVARRAAGEPVQHLTGHQEFWGLDFEVTPDVLIPRPETEHLIEVTLDRLALREVREGRPQATQGSGLLIADVGTGSGCIAIALAKQLPKATFYAGDISRAALEVARRNAAKHGVLRQIEFANASLLDHARGSEHQPARFDAIVSNPPYIGLRAAAGLDPEVRDHEPPAALFGGQEGYEFYGELIAQATAHLVDGGLLVLELGYDSLPAVQPLLEGPEWTRLSITNDLAGIPRIIAAERGPR